ncbi:MAG: glycoside hydrolase family 43 protein [Lachnospiraceae bacterium]
MLTVQNPVLPGFHPDPSMVRVGDDYYIATSTFEWYPGVEIHHSRDLVHWELLCRPLVRKSQLDMVGEAASTGVWAPDLTYKDGTFYLIYTDVKTGNGGYTFYDVHNYLVTTTDLCGEWSDPVYLNSSGFDPSLFHDDDGRAYLVNMLFDYRPWNIRFAGIVMQEYSYEEKKLIGEPKNIFGGTTRRVPEGPHIYKRNGYYYLFLAEGGTKFDHCETVARSKRIEGPYELAPINPLITSKPYPLGTLQKAGHASLVEGRHDQWYLAFLCGRPVGPDRCCILGRETSINAVVWENDWPRMKQGYNGPVDSFEVWEDDVDTSWKPSENAVVNGQSFRDDFEDETWNLRFQTLRKPLEDRASLTERPGYLRLYGKESLESRYETTILATRQQHFCFQADTKVEFHPVSYQQMAGITYFYDDYSHYYLFITRDEQQGRVITMYQKILNQFSMPIGVGISIPDEGEVYLRVVGKKETAQFLYSLDGEHYAEVGPVLDATVLSDDYYRKISTSRFTGAFIGIACQDIAGRGAFADFDYFEYKGF